MEGGQGGLAMLRPICNICQGGDNVPRDWYLACDHDPYVTLVEISRKVPRYEDVPGEDGEPTGTRRVVGTDTLVDYEPRPNLTDVTLSTRVNSGKGVEMARRKGFILPEELVSPSFPGGIAPMCQFRGCTWQKDLRTYKWGTFCREDEARLVGTDEKGMTLEIGFDSNSSEKRRTQLDSVAV